MRIVERYIIKSIVTVFFTTVFIFCFLYILIDMASNLSDIIDRKVPAFILADYYLSFLPIILGHTSPIACLIAVLLTYSHLNTANEIIALRTSGLNFWRLTKPAIYFGLIVSAFLFLINERLIPQANVTSQEIKNENLILKVDSERKKKGKIRNLTFYGLKNRLYFIDSFDRNTFDLEGITIIGQDDSQNLKEKIVALKGKWTGIAWKFYQCQITTFTLVNNTLQEEVNYYEEKLTDIKETPQDFIQQRIDVTSMNLDQLYDYILRFANSGATKALNNLRVDLHQKIAFPTRNLVILLVGLPLVLMTQRRSAVTFTSIAIATAIGFLFYVVEAVGLALGKGGYLSPIVSAWLAPAIFFLTAIYLIKIKFH